ncbi:lysylphosphatidylglycerol synthase transmembrane domain-containing protein [Lutibacter sp.]|uniref:lysylphosphatidylglycerol synthase transmembrane domain-containing protein n=1 Tax=Lutibacter sp. TaxID=1925666 RepID=UPI0027375EE2|nr:lysylphosphatidylglycerol synthase transmembrane domain-containing protein [Lutibacter sp.]MDP3313824.1 lysylphosphatidylglycerol synthase transmembrane domain-containing protein [Lutibacter sp.]
MAFKLKKTIFISLPIALGVFLIWYSFSRLSPSDIESIKNSFKTANYWWVGLSVVLGILSHLSRAYRWQFLLEPMGYKLNIANSVMTVLVSHLLNLFVPRSGEFARAASIKKYDKIPFEKAIGTIFAERVIDVFMLLIIIGFAFYLQTELIASYIFTDNLKSSVYSKVFVFGVLPILGYFTYRFLKKSEIPLIIKTMKFVDGLIDGLKSIITMKKKWKFIFHTFFIWGMYLLMFYVVTFALPETTNLSLSAIIVGFVLGAISMALTNGGLGSYPVLVASALILYRIDDNAARAFGWIMWTAQTLMVVVFGSLSLIFLPIYNKKK